MKYIFGFLVLWLTGISNAQYEVPFGGDKDWLMPFCTVEFNDGKVIYKYPADGMFIQIKPHYYNPDLFQAQEVSLMHMWEDKHRYEIDIDIFVETFDITKNDIEEKDRFIRACILQMIWTSQYQNLFSINSLTKLQALSQDRSPQIAEKAQKALKIYRFYQSSEHFHRKRLLTNNLSQYIKVRAEDSTVNIVFSEKAIARYPTAVLQIISRENRIKIEQKVKVSQDTVRIDIGHLWKDIFLVSMQVSGKDVENVKFIKYTEGPPRFPVQQNRNKRK